MKKVKLTREQVNEIERIKKTDIDEYEFVCEFARVNGINNAYFHLDELIRALYIGYEIEPKFKVGDWVVDGESVYEIISKQHADDLNKGKYPKARHATPEEIAEEKQRRWWERHGLKVWELKVGDVLMNDNNTPFVVVKVEGDTIHFHNKGWVYREDLIEWNEWMVICFAEDREDIGRSNE